MDMQALELQPNSGKGHYRAALSLMHMQRPSAALMAVKSGLAVLPSNPQLLALLRQLGASDRNDFRNQRVDGFANGVRIS